MKNHNFKQILTFGGLLYSAPFTNEGQIWCARAEQWSTFTSQISSQLGCSFALWRKNPHFVIFLNLAFCGVASWQQSEKVEHGCTTTSLPQSTSIKIVSVLQCLHDEIVCTISDSSKAWWTNRQIKIETVSWATAKLVACKKSLSVPNLVCDSRPCSGLYACWLNLIWIGVMCYVACVIRQCCDTVGWAAGRASGL